MRLGNEIMYVSVEGKRKWEEAKSQVEKMSSEGEIGSCRDNGDDMFELSWVVTR